jgi:hypothetical protein
MHKVLTVLLFVLLFVSCSSTEHQRRSIEFPIYGFLQINHKVFFKTCAKEKCEESSNLIRASGFVLAGRKSLRKDGAIGVTAGHACDLTDRQPAPHRSSLRVSMIGGSVYSAEVVKIYTEADICIIRIKGVHLRGVVLSKVKPKKGDRAFTMAAPFGIFSDEMVLLLDGYYSGRDTRSYDLYTVPARPGSSGSPILNWKGQITGITSMAAIRFEHLTISPNYEAVRDILSHYE